MKKNNIFLRILTEIWQLPQHIIAYIIMLVNRKSIKPMTNNDCILYYLVDNLFNSGISLGNYIFLDSNGYYNYTTVKHEHGHQIQSLIFSLILIL